MADDRYTGLPYVAKFYLITAAFNADRAIYADLANPLRRFLPGLRAIVSNSDDAWQHGQQAHCVDRCGVLMPPCIVTEKGEPLETWLEGFRDGVPAARAAKVRRGYSRPRRSGAIASARFAARCDVLRAVTRAGIRAGAEPDRGGAARSARCGVRAP